MISNLKASGECSDFTSCLQAEGHSNEESNLVTCAQEPKPGKTISPKTLDERKDTTKELSDLNASTCKRGQSPHSSKEPKIPNSQAKEGSVKYPALKQGSRSMISNQSLRMLVTSQLDQYKNGDGKYNAIIRILADAGFLQYCYMLIKGKPGNMSKGITRETLDGISYEWFCNIAEELKTGKFKFTSARRVMIPKPGKNGVRPLGVGAPREKIVQKGLQIILEAIYEPLFLDCSHGFRPERSTHSALKPLHLRAHHYSWVIQGDISKCFDRIPHDNIMKLMREKITCERLLELVRKALIVGYLDPKTKRITKTNIGTPQGSVLSPLLANIVLHELDKFINDELMPIYNRGKIRRTNHMYNSLTHIRHTKKDATLEERENALKMMMLTPRMDSRDPNYRRSMYIRYADDFVYLFEGPIAEAKIIKERIKDALHRLTGLELNDEKTLITHLNDGFHFLGAYIKGLKHVGYMMKTTVKGKVIRMRANVRARINMPTAKLIEKLITSGFARINHEGQVLARPVTKLVNMDHSTIVQFFNSKVYGFLNYYTFAANRIETQNLI
jgi:group II intron reverse transcriptase/maturase